MSWLDTLSEKYNTAKDAVLLNPRGFTPFQFSSRKMQINTTQLGGLIPDNPISDLLNEAMSWYEMWINPEKVAMKRPIKNKMQHTAGSIVTYHYRPDVITMSVAGKCGWIMIPPYEEEESKALGFKSSRLSGALLGGAIGGATGSGTAALVGAGVGAAVSNKRNMALWDKDKFMMDPGKNNSPRVFLKRLREMAEEPMYFVDLHGVEHYNTKYIKIYTKQYPTGVVCEGYYNSFNVPEEGSDDQTIAYDFDFIIERIVPISTLQKMAGMFGNKGTALGRAMRSIPGLS